MGIVFRATLELTSMRHIKVTEEIGESFKLVTKGFLKGFEI